MNSIWHSLTVEMYNGQCQVVKNCDRGHLGQTVGTVHFRTNY